MATARDVSSITTPRYANNKASLARADAKRRVDDVERSCSGPSVLRKPEDLQMLRFSNNPGICKWSLSASCNRPESQ